MQSGASGEFVRAWPECQVFGEVKPLAHIMGCRGAEAAVQRDDAVSGVTAPSEKNAPSEAVPHRDTAQAA